MTYLLSLDPGMSSGLVLGAYTDTEPFHVVEMAQVTGGLKGFISEIWNMYVQRDSLVICEKFTPRPNNGGGGLSLKSVEPLRIEGYLVGNRYLPDYSPQEKQWRQPSQQYLGGGTLAEKKKLARDFLRECGMLSTGKDVGQPDADDVNSATMHALNYLRDKKHMPTLEAYYK